MTSSDPPDSGSRRSDRIGRITVKPKHRNWAIFLKCRERSLRIDLGGGITTDRSPTVRLGPSNAAQEDPTPSGLARRTEFKLILRLDGTCEALSLDQLNGKLAAKHGQ